MKPSLWRAGLAALAACFLPMVAAAQADNCASDLLNAAFLSDTSPDTAKLNCDLDRAAKIRDRARLFYGPRSDAIIEITDTASPSGAAYLYDVMTDGAGVRLDARSVPDGKGPHCRLQTKLPDDTANAMTILLGQVSDASVPSYGPREEVTVNADGSRTVRLVIESHDIITRTQTENGVRQFSRHAGSDDPVTRLNNLVIGVANVSPNWVCKAP
ncbi:MAG: hypothetical protein IPK75_08360 [Acidobacteria bacterium]|jgi:hypothetical protein|nr:hypothetical protein [Acidobacteriota bacterium]